MKHLKTHRLGTFFSYPVVLDLAKVEFIATHPYIQRVTVAIVNGKPCSYATSFTEFSEAWQSYKYPDSFNKISLN